MKFYLLLILSVALIGFARCDPIPEDSKTDAESKEAELVAESKEVLETAKEKLDTVQKNLENHAVNASKELNDMFGETHKALLVKCSDNSECGHGVCANKVCQCNEGFTSKDKACDYEQKSKTSAFLLSLFLGNFGADWFYLARENSNYNWAGFFKLFLGFCVIIASCFKCCAQTCFKVLNEGKVGAAFRVVVGGTIALASLINVVWYFVDWIRILCDSFPDGNGVALKGW